jgi:hypothetical protein
MSRIVIRDSVARRTVPAPQLDGEIEITLGEETTVTVPRGVTVRQRD